MLKSLSFGSDCPLISVPTGRFPEHVSNVKQRFSRGLHKPDFNRCAEERNKFSELTSEWACSRYFVTLHALLMVVVLLKLSGNSMRFILNFDDPKKQNKEVNLDGEED